MKKRTYGIIAALVAVCAAAGVAFWLLSSGSPSYDKICRMNDDLKQARQLGLSTQEKCAERLGNAILNTTDETVLANLLANVSFEERFANAILGKIQSPEVLETVARTFKAELLADSSENPFSESLYDAVLDRLPDDSSVERIAVVRLAEMGGASDARTGTRGKKSSGKSELATCLCRRILAMDDAERAEALLEKMGESDVLRDLPFETRLGIALRSKNEKVRHATGVDREYLELGDLVAKWDPNCQSRSVREIIARGRELQNAQEYIEVVKRFDPDFKSNDIDKWVEYAKSVTPVLESIDLLSAKTKTDFSNSSDSFDSSRRASIVEKRDKAKKSVDEYKKVIDDVRAAVDANNVATIMAACEFVGVRFDASDPEDTGWRLGNKLKQRYQEAKSELEEAEREFAAFHRAANSQSEKERETRKKEIEISRLNEQLDTIRQSYETPESRKAREERKAAEAKEWARQLGTSSAVKSAAENILASMVDIPGKDFKMGKTEVTQAQWEAIMGENFSKFKGENNPVENVSWNDCQEFISRLNSIPTVEYSGLTFRLPKEAEWEYACRAGASGKFCKLVDGTEITESTLGQVAWFHDNSDQQTHPVGQKQPNAFGLYDMNGNVWEWCQEEFGQIELVAKGKNNEHFRVFHGGRWGDVARWCESSVRQGISPSLRYSYLGFRLCADVRAD